MSCSATIIVYFSIQKSPLRPLPHKLHSLKSQSRGTDLLHKKAPFIFHEWGRINFSNSPGGLIHDDKILFPHILPPGTRISISVPETYFQFVYFSVGQRL